MVNRNYPSIAYVNQALIYAHGSLFWVRERPREHFKSNRSWRNFNNKFSDEEAGWPFFSEHGNYWRWQIWLSGKSIYRSVIVWAVHHGVWPTSEVDHVNHNTLDDRPENLRLATGSQNRANAIKRSDNSSGFKGVTWHSRDGRWVARIQVEKKRINLGFFDTPEDAHAEYCKAAIQHFGEFARFE